MKFPALIDALVFVALAFFVAATVFVGVSSYKIHSGSLMVIQVGAGKCTCGDSCPCCKACPGHNASCSCRSE